LEATLGVAPRSANGAVLLLDYLSSEKIASQSPAWWQNVLGVVGFEKPPAIDGARAPITASMTPSLGLNDDLCEVWRVEGADVRMSNGTAERSRLGPARRGCANIAAQSTIHDENRTIRNVYSTAERIAPSVRWGRENVVPPRPSDSRVVRQFYRIQQQRASPNKDCTTSAFTANGIR